MMTNGEDSNEPPFEDEEWERQEEFINFFDDQADEYRERLEEIQNRRSDSEKRLSLLVIFSSLASSYAMFYLGYERNLIVLGNLDILFVGAIFGVLALGAALGIARWAFFDIVTTNALRRD